MVVDDPAVNAFALPGGLITINRGPLESVESGEQVAVVLAHEIHHKTERHGLKRMARQLTVWTLVGWALSFIDIGSFTSLVIGLVHAGYDRDQERDADRLGHRLLVKADIDPSGMAVFFSRLAETQSDGLTLFSTHPASEERAATVGALPGLAGAARKLSSPQPYGCFAASERSSWYSLLATVL